MADYDPQRAAQIIAQMMSSMTRDVTQPSDNTLPTSPVSKALQEALGIPTSSSGTVGSSVGNQLVGGYSISSGYGGARNHPGIDIAVPAGTGVHAATSGTVTHAGNDDPGGYGAWVEITAPDGTVTRYGHLSGISVQPGQQIIAGQSIGASGGAKGSAGSGNSTGPHLHFEVRRGGSTVDPTGLLGGFNLFGDSASLAGAIVPSADNPTVSVPEPEPGPPVPEGEVRQAYEIPMFG